MAAFGREAGPSASSAGGNPFSIFPWQPTSSTRGGFLLPLSQTFGVSPNSHPDSYPSSLRAPLIPETNDSQSSPPPLYDSSSGYAHGSDNSMEFLSNQNLLPGRTRFPVHQSHYAQQSFRNFRAVPQRRGESPYVWIKGQTPPVEKNNSGISEVVSSNSTNHFTKSQNVKNHIVPPAKTEQINSSLRHNSIQRPFTSPQKNQGIAFDGEMHAFVEMKARFPMNQEIHDSKCEQKDFSRETLAETTLEITNPAWSKISESTAVNDSSSIRISGNPLAKRTRSLRVTDACEALPGNKEFSEDDSSDRECQAKVKRLIRFKQELHHDCVVGTHPKSQLMAEEETLMVEGDISMEKVGETSDERQLSESVNPDKLKIITGLCPHMCPESERGERERKGDLDQYERLDGDRNLSSKSLAVKKYNRTAEREALLIRPMPVLQKTMDYLLHLLDIPYDDRFLGLYNFLWDRMRAIRMDLRMQHLFNLKAIDMLEQMIRLHIVAMHELCEYSKGEGFSEGFDAHLNIEQMNKTSVELFQMYDDHRNKGIPISSEPEFRGYYALLKLDKHPGYKVDPGELSLDLSKMTKEIRQTAEVRCARDVARACRTGNFTAFFRLARKASYLQACLMHAHFAKLRTVALAAIHSGLQVNQGLPVTHVAQWLVMEDEDIESLLDYHGFAIKEFEEPYMVKEGKFLNGDKDFPTKCSKLVHFKKSSEIMKDIVQNDQATVGPQVENLQAPLVSATKTVGVLPLSVNLDRKAAPVVDEQMSEVDQKDDKTNSVLSQPSNPPASQQSPGVHRINANGFPPLRNSISISSPKPKIIFEDTTPKLSPYNPALMPVNPPRSLSTSHSDNKKASPFFKTSVEKSFPEIPKDTAEIHEKTPSHFEEPQTIDENNFHDETADDDEVLAIKMKLKIRKWKRRASQIKMRRNQRLMLSSAALDALTVGPFFLHFNEPKKLRNSEQFDIDKIVNERLAKHHESWSTINISDEIGDILWVKNPHSDHLFWKLLLFFPTEDHNSVDHWLRHKLMPFPSENVAYSSTSLSIGKKWFPDQHGCCVSFVRVANPAEATESFAGASGIMFPLSDSLSLTSQKCLLNDLIGSLPSNASLPLVILASKSSPDFEDFDIDRTRVSSVHVVHLVENDGAFFSDARLRGALQWLATNAPSQPDLVRVEVRRLVLSHLNALLHGDLLPDLCVSAFNKSLELALENVALSAECCNSDWPCPETRLLEGDVACHVSHGWSSLNRIEEVVQGVRSYCLPGVQWANRGLDSYSAIEDFKAKLGNDFVEYMVHTCGTPMNLAAVEAHVMLQKCTDLSLSGNLHYLLPNWKAIFRRIFYLRVTNMSFDAYVSRNVYNEMVTRQSFREESDGLQKPTLDEMIHASVGCLLFEKGPSIPSDSAAEEANSALHVTEETKSALHVTEETKSVEEVNEELLVDDGAKVAVSRLDQLLERCHRMLDANERKLRLYF